MWWWIFTLWLALWPGSHVPSWIGSSRPATPVPVPLVLGAVGKNGAGVTRLPYRWSAVTTTYYHASATQAVNIEITASRMNGTVLQPGQVFSYYEKVGPYTAANGYGWGRAFVGDRIVPSVGGGVCQGASTLYAAVLRTGLKVLERHQHGLLVPYLPPGEDATVSADYLNFRFQNSSDHPVLIAASAGDRHYRIAIWGAVPGPHITVRHEILARYPFRTLYRTDLDLKPGQQEVMAPGQEGVKARTWLEVQTASGTRNEDLGVDIYRPSPRIVLVGPGTTAPTVRVVTGPAVSGSCEASG